jgi:S-(hydroxymethyl)glutathione dehydrogenase/alcohol dehydrogenase
VIRAAVLTSVGSPLTIEEIELPEPAAGEVHVRLAAAGVCHSDLSLANGTLEQPVPAVLGHEGTGTVIAIGLGVTNVSPGDHVLLNWSPSCGSCWFCLHGEPYLCDQTAKAWQRRYARLADGTPLYAGLGTATFGEETIVPGSAVLGLPSAVNLEGAALLGCAMLTGIGAVINSADVQPGESVVVFGTGGVGLSVLQGARLVGAEVVIGVDIAPEKEGLARTNGAMDFIVADDKVARRIRERTGGRGADHAFDCVGSASTIRQAWSSTRRGGRTTVVGIGAKDEKVEFRPQEFFYSARAVSGCVFGSTDIVRDLPRLLEHVQAGRIRPEDLVTNRIRLEDAPEALAQMSARKGARSLIVYSQPPAATARQAQAHNPRGRP